MPCAVPGVVQYFSWPASPLQISGETESTVSTPLDTFRHLLRFLLLLLLLLLLQFGGSKYIQIPWRCQLFGCPLGFSAFQCEATGPYKVVHQRDSQKRAFLLFQLDDEASLCLQNEWKSPKIHGKKLQLAIVQVRPPHSHAEGFPSPQLREESVGAKCSLNPHGKT